MPRLMIEFLVRSTLIALSAGATITAFRVRAASARHAVWVAVTLAMLLLPAWIAWGPKMSLPVLPTPPELAVPPRAVVSIPDAAVAAPMPAAGRQALRPAGDRSSAFFPIYGLGVALLLLRLIIGTIRAERLTTACCFVPITVGLLRPRIILPQSASEWTAAQLSMVMAHEQAHVRRRDPLFHWLALFNRAIFWFHPLAWWLERILAALAEDACDEAVLEQGHDPRRYSMCLLEMARAVERTGMRVSPMVMPMPGVYLPQRIKRIAGGVRGPRLSRTRLASAGVGCAILAALFAGASLGHRAELPPRLSGHQQFAPQAPQIGLAQAPQQAHSTPAAEELEFETASIRPTPPPAEQPTVAVRNGTFPRMTGGPGTDDPEHLSIIHMPLRNLLFNAYGIRPDQISGPDWLDAEAFDVTATIAPGTTKEQVNTMLQNLLIERFKLEFHHSTKDVLAYELTVSKKGSKLKEVTRSSTASGPHAGEYFNMSLDAKGFPVVKENDAGLVFRSHEGLTRMTCRACTIKDLVGRLREGLTELDDSAPYSRMFTRLVDRTGLAGTYDFHLEALGSLSYIGGMLNPPPVDGDGGPRPDIFSAVEDQLGLKLQKTKVPVDVLVIDHIERVPTAN